MSDLEAILPRMYTLFFALGAFTGALFGVVAVLAIQGV